MNENSISLWISALRSGDESAAAALWDRYFQRLMHVARGRMKGMPRSSYDEEDAAISTFRVLCQKLAAGEYPELADRDALWSVMLTVLVRKVLRRFEYESAQKRGQAVSMSTGIETAQREDLSPLVSEECEHLLTRLDDDLLEQVVVLKLDGFTNDDVAQQLGKSIRTVQRMLTLIREIWVRDANETDRD